MYYEIELNEIKLIYFFLRLSKRTHPMFQRGRGGKGRRGRGRKRGRGKR